MTANVKLLRHASIGILLDRHRIVASLPGRRAEKDRIWTHPLTAASDVTAGWPDLEEALRSLRSIVDGTRVRLHVALLPPVAELRLLELPGLQEAEAELVVRRDTARFFPRRYESPVVELQGSGWRRRSPFVAVATPSQVVDDVGIAAQHAGFEFGGIVPAQLAWAASMPKSSAPQDLLVALDNQLLLLRVRNRRIVATRRLPKGEADLSPAALRQQLATEDILLSADATLLLSADEVAACAATAVVRVAAPLFLPEESRARVRRRARLAVLSRLSAAALLVAAAGALELAGLRHERHRVAAERSRISGAVSQSLTLRDSIALLRDRLAAVRDLESSSSQWSGLMSSIADALPRDAFLKSLIVDGDSLKLEGSSERAAPVFDAVAAVAGVVTVHPTAPIRQEVRGGAMDEQFALAALLARTYPSVTRTLPNAQVRSAPGSQP